MEGIENKEKPRIDLVRATEQDADKYLEMEKSFSDLKTYSTFTERDEVVKELKEDNIYFIQHEGETVGRVGYTNPKNDRVYLSDLVILPPFQNQGFGREALEKALSQIGEVPTINLIVHPDNMNAIKLYESFGFTKGEVKQDYFGDGEPRLMMVKNNEN